MTLAALPHTPVHTPSQTRAQTPAQTPAPAPGTGREPSSDDAPVETFALLLGQGGRPDPNAVPDPDAPLEGEPVDGDARGTDERSVSASLSSPTAAVAAVIVWVRDVAGTKAADARSPSDAIDPVSSPEPALPRDPRVLATPRQNRVVAWTDATETRTSRGARAATAEERGFDSPPLAAAAFSPRHGAAARSDAGGGAGDRVSLRPAAPSALPLEASSVPRRLDMVLEPARLGSVRLTLAVVSGVTRLTIATSTDAGFAALSADNDLILPILREIRSGEGNVQVVVQSEATTAGQAPAHSHAWTYEGARDPQGGREGTGPDARRRDASRHDGRARTEADSAMEDRPPSNVI